MPDDTEAVTALEPCPFCGEKAQHFEILEPEDPNFGAHFISCTSPACEASSNLQWSCKEDARPLLAERWNRRPPAPDAVRAAKLYEVPANRAERHAACLCWSEFCTPRTDTPYEYWGTVTEATREHFRKAAGYLKDTDNG